MIPNLLLISMDALRWDALGCYGERQAHTPRLDRLAGEGVRFDRAYCTQPHCMPSRASLLTGRYPRAHGVWDNGIDLPASETSLFDILRRNGVQTGSFGKFHFQAYKNGFYPDYTDKEENPEGRTPYRGFEHIAIADNTPYGGYRAWVRERFPEWEAVAADPYAEAPEESRLAWVTAMPAEATKTDWIAEEAGAFLRNTDPARPFAAWVSFVDPHHPYNPPQAFARLHDGAPIRPPVDPESDLAHLPAHYRRWREEILCDRFGLGDEPRRNWEAIRRCYRGKVSHVDDRIGRLLDLLGADGRLDNTLVVFFADHGTPLCDYGLAQVGPYGFESNIRVPLLVRGPGVSAGRVCGELVSLVDVLPTYFDLCGLKLPLGVQGRSFRGVLDGSAYAPRERLLVENRWGQSPDGFKTMVKKQWKLSLYANGKEGELYDLGSDPEERNNLFLRTSVRDERLALSEELALLLLRTEDPLPERTGAW